MARWLLTLLALSAVAVAVVLAAARPGALSRPGTFAQPVAAVADAEPSATPTPWAYIDKIKNGNGWCDPDHIDNETTEYVGDSHQLAVCMGNLPEAVHAFILYLSYDIDLDQCVEELCTDDFCLDTNPDANAGISKWGDGLGDNWDCSNSLQNPDPMCTYYTNGPPELPFILCAGGEEATYTLGDNETWGALAVIDFDVIGIGTDNVFIESLWVAGQEGGIGGCQAVQVGDARTLDTLPMPCEGATDHKELPPTSTPHKRKPIATPTTTEVPTATPVAPTVPPPPPATATPSGGVGPEIVAPTTGSGPTDSGFTWAIWLAAGIAGAAAGGGFYFRYAKKTR